MEKFAGSIWSSVTWKIHKPKGLLHIYILRKEAGCGSRAPRSLGDTEITQNSMRHWCCSLCMCVCVGVLMHLLLKSLECYFEIACVASFLRQAWSWTHHVVKDNLKLLIILLSPPEWDYGHVSPCPALCSVKARTRGFVSARQVLSAFASWLRCLFWEAFNWWHLPLTMCFPHDTVPSSYEQSTFHYLFLSHTCLNVSCVLPIRLRSPRRQAPLSLTVVPQTLFTMAQIHLMLRNNVLNDWVEELSECLIPGYNKGV